jgi:hypothetical protein
MSCQLAGAAAAVAACALLPAVGNAAVAPPGRWGAGRRPAAQQLHGAHAGEWDGKILFSVLSKGLMGGVLIFSSWVLVHVCSCVVMLVYLHCYVTEERLGGRWVERYALKHTDETPLPLY